MPHYKDGSESRVGDYVKGKAPNGDLTEGVVVQKRPRAWPDMVVAKLELIYVEGRDFELVHRPE